MLMRRTIEYARYHNIQRVGVAKLHLHTDRKQEVIDKHRENEKLLVSQANNERKLWNSSQETQNIRTQSNLF